MKTGLSAVVPVSGQLTGVEEADNLREVIETGNFAYGRFNKLFSRKIRDFLGAKKVTLCNSGSSADLLAMLAFRDYYGLKQGDYIVTTALSFPTTVSSIYYAGLLPLYIDIDPFTWNFDPEQLYLATKFFDVAGAIFTHTLGVPFAVDAIPQDLPFIEDNCDAFGSLFDDGEYTGSKGIASTLSFYPAHHITSLDYSELVFVQDRLGYIHLLPIGEFVEKVYKYNDGWKCVSFDKFGKLSFSEITDTVKHLVNEDLYKVKLQTGREVVISESHNLFTADGDKIICKSTKEFSVGDLVFAPNKLPNYDEIKTVPYIDYEKGSWKPHQVMLQISYELGRLLGYFVAEGSYNKTKSGNYGIVFTFGETEIDFATEVVHLLSCVFSSRARTCKRGSAIDVKCSNKGLYDFLSFWCGVGAENKRIPEFLFSAPTDVKKAFIDSYYNGDGCDHYTYGAHKGYSRDCVTVSSHLAKGLVYLLLQLGINSRYSVKSVGGERNFGEYTSDVLPSYAVCYSDRSIFDAKGFRGQKENKNRQFEDLSLVKIVSIDKVSPTTDYVYDLSVRGKENFVGGIGCIVHNTGEGGAVVTRDQKFGFLVDQYRDWGRACWCNPGFDNTCGKRFEHQIGDLPYGYDHKYTYEKMGFNLKMTNMQAAIGSAQIDKLLEFKGIRTRNYYGFFGNLDQEVFDHFEFQGFTGGSDSPNFFGIGVKVKEGGMYSRQYIISELESKGIATRPLFAGNITKHPAFMSQECAILGDLKHTDTIMNDAFWIGCWQGLYSDQMIFMANVFNQFAMDADND